jgi:hypothetical protein
MEKENKIDFINTEFKIIEIEDLVKYHNNQIQIIKVEDAQLISDGHPNLNSESYILSLINDAINFKILSIADQMIRILLKKSKKEEIFDLYNIKVRISHNVSKKFNVSTDTTYMNEVAILRKYLSK